MTAFLVDEASSRILTFDAIINELHETVSEVTDHPVEVGVNVADHVRPLPDRVSLLAYVTNQPILEGERGALTSFKLDVPKFTPPLEPTPGSIFRSTVAAVEGLLFGEPENTAQVVAFPSFFDAIGETYDTLLEFQKNAVLLQIVDNLRNYENMVIERVAAPRTVGDSGVEFGIDLRQLRIVTSGEVAAPPVPEEPRGQGKGNKGGQGAKPTGEGEDAKKPRSLALQGLQSLGIL